MCSVKGVNDLLISHPRSIQTEVLFDGVGFLVRFSPQQLHLCQARLE